MIQIRQNRKLALASRLVFVVLCLSSLSACEPWADTAIGNVDKPGAELSLVESTTDADVTTVAAGAAIKVTVHLRNVDKAPYIPGNLIPKRAANKVAVRIADEDVALTTSSTGTWTEAVDNGDGSFTATFTGAKAGTPISVVSSVDGVDLTSTAPKITVIAGAPKTLTIASGDAQNGISGANLSAPIALVVKDAFDNLVPAANVNFTVTGGGGSFTSAVVASGADGTVNATWTLGLAPGVNSAQASVNGTSGPIVATFSAVGAPGVPATLTVLSGNNQHRAVGLALSAPMIAVVKDVNGNFVPNAALDWSVSPTGGAAHATLNAASSTTASNGQGSNTLTFGSTPETATITVSVHGAAPAITATFTEIADPGPAASLVLVTGPTNTVADNTIAAMSVKAIDSYGNTATSFTGTIDLSLVTNPTSATLTGTLSVSAVAGVANFGAVTLRKAGTGYTLHATSSGLTASSNSSAFNITAGAVTSIAVSSGNTQSGVAGNALGASFAAVVKDAYANVVSGATVDWVITGGHGSLSSASNLTDLSGISNSILTLGTLAESETVTATVHSTSLVATFTATANAGAATQLVMTAGPATRDADTAQPNIVVQAQDANGNIDTTYTAAVGLSFVNNPSSTTLSGTTSVNAVAGVATFTGIAIRKVGNGYTIHATSGSLSASAASAGFNVTAGAASTIAVSTGNSQSGAVATQLGAAFVAVVKDAYANVVPSITVDWAITGGHGSLSPASNSTDSSGFSSSTLTLGTVAETETVTATLHGTSTSASFTATANPGAPVNLSLVAVPSPSATAGAAWTGLKVKALDSYGNIATSYTGSVTLAFVNNPTSATLAGTLTQAATAGVASYTNVSVSKVGTGYTIAATGTLGIAASGTSSAFDITNANASQIVVTTAPSASTVAGVAFATMPVFTLKDTYGNVVTTGPDSTANIALTLSQGTGTLSGTSTLAAIAGVADFSRTNTGPAVPLTVNLSGTNKKFTATKADTSGSGGSASVAVTTGTFTIVNSIGSTLVFVTQPQSGTLGSNASPNVELRDSFGNPVISGVDASKVVNLSLASGTGALAGNTAVTLASGDANFATHPVSTTTGGTKTITATLTTAASTVLTVTSSSFTVGEVPHAVTVAGPASANMTECSTAFTVTLKDTNNQTINATSPTTVSLGGKGGGTFYSDAACTTSKTAIAIASGSSSATFYFKDPGAESLLFNLSSSGLSSGTLPFTVTTGNYPMKLGWSGTTSINAGTCSAFTITALNSSNAAANVSSNTLVTLSNTLSGGFYQDASCATATSSTAITSGTSAVTVYFKDSLIETQTLNAAQSTLASASYSVTTTSSGNRLAVTGPSTLSGGACSTAITVQVTDSSSNPVNVSGAKTINLTTTGLGSFYSDSSCSTAVTSATIANGTSSTTTYYRAGLLGEPSRIIAAESTGGILAGSLAVTVSPVTYATGAGALGLTHNGRVSCAVLAAGGVACWGKDMPNGAYPQLIPGLSNIVQVQAGSDHACSLDNAGTIKCWGINSNGQFGNSATNSNWTSVPATTGFGTASSLAVSDTLTCAVYSDGTVKCAGYSAVVDSNWSTHTSPTQISGLTNVTKFTLGSGYGCALLGDHTVKCMGYNSAYAINGGWYGYYGPTAVPNLSNVTDISTGGSITCALNSGDAYCWGVEYSAGFGDNTTYQYTPIPHKVLNLTNGVASQLSTGYSYACVVTTANDIKCWGDNSQGQLFDASRAYGANAMTAVSTQVTSGAMNLSTGYNQSCYTTSAGQIFCAGDSFNGNKGDFQAPTSTGGIRSRNILPLAQYRYSLSLAPTGNASSIVNSQVCVAMTLRETNMGLAGNFSNAMTVTLSDGSAGGTFYSDAQCSTSITSVAVNAADPAKTLYYKIATAGTAVNFAMTSTVSSYALLTAGFTSSGAPSKIALVTPNSYLIDGSCSRVEYMTTDASSIEVPVAADLSVAFINSATLSSYSDAACTQATNALFFAQGTSRSVAYIKVANSYGTMTVSQAGLTSTGFGFYPISAQFDPSPSYSMHVGECNARNINLVNGTFLQPTTVTIAATLGGVYADANCSAPLTSFAMPAGAWSYTAYIFSPAAGTGNLSVTVDAKTNTQAVTYDATGQYQLVFTGATSATTNSCQTYALKLTNVGDGSNATFSSDVAVQLLGSTFYDSGACTNPMTDTVLPANTNQILVYMKQASAASLILRTLTMVYEITDASLPVTITNPATTPAKLSLAGSTSINATTCTPYTVSLLDSNNASANATASTTVTMSGNLSGTFYSNSGCTTASALVTIASGTNTGTVYFKDTTAESTTLSATATGLTNSTLAVTVSGAGTTHLAITGPTTFTNPACSSAFTISVLDSSNAASNVSGAKTINLAGAGGGAFYSDAACASAVTSRTIANGTSTATFYYMPSGLDESATLRASESTGAITGATYAVTSTAPTVSSLAMGYQAACFVGSNGYAYCWGSDTGVLQNAGSHPVPKAVSNLNSVAKVAVGYNWACALLTDATVKCWGSNNYGGLGNGSTNSATPVALSLTGVVDIVLTNYTGCALLNNGAIKCWGYNYAGQVGTGSRTTNTYATPASVNSMSAFTLLSRAGYERFCATDVQRNTYCWGQGGSGSNYGTFISTGDSQFQPLLMTGMSNMSSATGNGDSICMMDADGVYRCVGTDWSQTWGETTYNYFVSTPKVITNVAGLSRVSNAGNSVCGLDSSQSVYCWGYEGNGEFADGKISQSLPTPTRNSAIPALSDLVSGQNSSSFCGLGTNGKIYCWGDKSRNIAYASGTPVNNSSDYFNRELIPSTLLFSAASPTRNTCTALSFGEYMYGSTSIGFRSAYAVNLTMPTGAGIFYSDAGCTQSITQVTVPQGATSQTVYVKVSSSGQYKIKASATGVAAAYAAGTLYGVPVYFSQTMGSYPISNGCVHMQAQLMDSSYQPAGFATNTTISVYDYEPDQSTVYTDASCTVPFDSSTGYRLKANVTTVDLWVSVPSMGWGGNGASIAFGLDPSNPWNSQLWWEEDGPYWNPYFDNNYFSANTCSPFNIYNNYGSISDDITYDISADDSSVAQIYTDPSCSNPVSSITFPAGQDTGNTQYYINGNYGSTNLYFNANNRTWAAFSVYIEMN